MSFRFIDQQVIAKQLIQQEPFDWCKFDNLIYPDRQQELFAHYPQENFIASSRLEGDKKNYQFSVLKIIHANKKETDYHDLHDTWRTFIDEIASANYLEALFNLFQIKTNSYHLDISLFRFGKQDWVEPHVDHEDKLLTQLFYFNKNWLEKWGGLLLLHHAPQPNKVFDFFTPCLAHSVAIKRMDNAWHSVTPVTNNAMENRLTLQVEVWK